MERVRSRAWSLGVEELSQVLKPSCTPLPSSGFGTSSRLENNGGVHEELPIGIEANEVGEGIGGGVLDGDRSLVRVNFW